MVAKPLHKAAAAFIAFLLLAGAAAPAADAAPSRPASLSSGVILKWINDYRHRPEPEKVPLVVRALSQLQAFDDAETCGAYIGFIAGVLGANPERARTLIAGMLPIARADRWVLVRAIAYSGLPNWKELLVSFADRMPARRPMINRYLEGKLPTLDQIAYPKGQPGMIDKIEIALNFHSDDKHVALQPSPQLIDVLWGYYLATGSYQPIGRIIKLLPLADDHNNVENLTTGSAAKFTLASNAVRDLSLLSMLQWSLKHQTKETAKVLKEVIVTAEDVDTPAMRRQSLDAIAQLKQKGPNARREIAGMGEIGEGVLSVGCIAAAATGQIELGLPCVIGGATYSAGVQYMSNQ